jgi:hypothetical protein
VIVKHDIEPHAGGPFHCWSVLRRLPGLGLASIDCSGIHTERTPAPRAPRSCPPRTDRFRALPTVQSATSPSRTASGTCPISIELSVAATLPHPPRCGRQHGAEGTERRRPLTSLPPLRAISTKLRLLALCPGRPAPAACGNWHLKSPINAPVPHTVHGPISNIGPIRR